MTSRAGILMFAAATALTTLFTLSPAPAAAPAPPSPIIAIVDLPKVLDGLKEREARDKELETAKNALQAKADELKKTLDAERQKLENLADTASKIPAAKAYREKVLRADFDLDYGKSLLAEQQATGLRELFEKISLATAEVAKARGYHLVLSSDQSVPVRGNTEEVSRTISLKRFLYVDPSMDITAELVQYMNNQFEAGAKK
jgi:Skp family chaperone for outer membrane proteins